MKKITGFILALTVSLLFLNAGLTLAQEETQEAQAQVAAGPEGQWIWGEVVSVDAANKAVIIKYLDYETDQEKEMAVATDASTTYENVKSIDEIKQQDTASIDYVVTLEGKNLAKNISVEKPEAEETEALQNEPPEEKPEAAAEVTE